MYFVLKYWLTLLHLFVFVHICLYYCMTGVLHLYEGILPIAE